MKSEDTQNKIKEIIFTHLNVSTISEVKKKMKDLAKYEYGCKSSRIDTGKGVTLIFTDNSNCFASYLIRLQGVGMVGEYALTSKDVTIAGKKRGCEQYYIFD